MSNDILINAALTVFGSIVGYLVKTFEERPRPAVLIESVAFKTIPLDKAPEVPIPRDIQELSARSTWIRTLSSGISFTELEALVKDHEDTVGGLKELMAYVPKLIQFVRNHEDETDYKEKYRKFEFETTGNRALNYLQMNIAGAIRRNELKLTQLKQIHPDVFQEEDLITRAVKADWKEVEDKAHDKAKTLAVALITEWFPTDLAEAAEKVRNDIMDEMGLNADILQGLQHIYRDAGTLMASEHLLIDTLLVNDGRSAVTFDRYGVLGISAINKAFFMMSDKDKDRISIAPGGAKSISLRSVDPLSLEEFKQLKGLYETKILRCSLTTRMIKSSSTASRWVTSPATEFSGETTALRNEFVNHARVPSGA